MTIEALAVIYRPDEHADEYLVFIDDEAEYNEWKAQPVGAKSIALARFVGNFEIYRSGTGHTGILRPIGKQDMETAFFGDDKKVKDKSIEAAIQLILQNGKEERRKSIKGPDTNLNPSRGGGEVKMGANMGR